MSNVYQILPKLTLNRRFIQDFIDETAPCFALGMVEERKQQYAVLLLRPGVAIPPDITKKGFEFGHSLRGSGEYKVVHFAFAFHGFETYNVLFNPSNPLAQAVLRSMVERGGYFILTVDQDQHVTAFRDDIGPQDLIGLADNYRRIQGSTTTEAQYRTALTQFCSRPHPLGRTLEWVCHDDIGYLDLTTDRMEVSPTPGRGAPPHVAAEPADPFPEPRGQSLDMLPTIAMVIDGERDSAEELRVSLLAARDRPHVLDDETVHRTIELCANQMEFVPIYREQIARWHTASPTRSQRQELSRLASQLDRHEVALKEVFALAEELKVGTIDAILRMEDGELGAAVLAGRIKPPDGEPHNDDMRLREQRAIAELLDARIEKLEQEGLRDLDLFTHLGPQMPLFKRLLDIAGPDDMSALCDEYHGLYRYTKLLELIAAGILFGDAKVPRR